MTNSVTEALDKANKAMRTVSDSISNELPDDLDGFGSGMKVKHLIKQLNQYREEYGDDFDNWTVYVEQCDEDDKRYKRTKQKWDIVKSPDYPDDPEEFWDEYFGVSGGIGRSPREKYITLNVNY